MSSGSPLLNFYRLVGVDEKNHMHTGDVTVQLYTRERL